MPYPDLSKDFRLLLCLDVIVLGAYGNLDPPELLLSDILAFDISLPVRD